MSHSEFRRVWLDESRDLDGLAGETDTGAERGAAAREPPGVTRESTPPASWTGDRSSENVRAAGLTQQDEDERSSTFSFPPPTVPGPLFSSIAPMALEAEKETSEAAERVRHRGVLMAIAVTAMVSAACLAVLGSYGLLTERSGAAWGWNWNAPAPAAAMQPLGESDPQSASGPSLPNPLDFRAGLPAQSPAEPSFAASQLAATGSPAGRRERSAPKAFAQAPSRPVSLVTAQRASAAVALDAVLKDASMRCREEGMSQVSARVTAVFAAEGVVQDVSVDVPSTATGVGGCLAVEARRARIEPFEGEPVTVTRMVPVR
jgi:hypothetical protein